MKKISNFFHPLTLQRKLSQSLLLGTFATLSVVASAVVLSSEANAQSPAVNDTEINSYAQAVLGMEPARQKAFDEIKKLIPRGDIPKIVCNDANSFNGLPSQAKDIAVNYCNRSQKVVEEHGLSIDRFNNITREIQNNNDLKDQVFRRLIYIQQQQNPAENR